MFLTIRGGNHRYDEVTFLKVFFIFSIVSMHLIQVYMGFLPEWVLKAASIGGTGVHVFFFCSGFGLVMSQKHAEQGYWSFLKKRFIKVYFPYAVVVLICFFVPIIKVNGSRIMALLSHLFMFKMFIPKYDESFGPFWFISTLFQFYVLFIPLYRAKKRWGSVSFFCCSILLSVAWWFFTAFHEINEIRVFGSFFLQYLWEFSLGMIISDLFHDKQEIRISNIGILVTAIIGIALEGILGIIGGTLKAFNDIPALLGFLSLGLLIMQMPYVNKLFIWIGEISYEWYLVHMLIFAIAFSILYGATGIIIAIVLSITSAYFYHILLNRFFYLKKK